MRPWNVSRLILPVALLTLIAFLLGLSAESAFAQRTVSLQKRWNYRSAPGTDSLLTWIDDVVQTPAGDLWVLDGPHRKIRVFTREGKPVRSLSITAESMQSRLTNLVLDDTGRVGVIEAGAANVQFYDVLGMPAVSVRPKSMNYPNAIGLTQMERVGSGFAYRGHMVDMMDPRGLAYALISLADPVGKETFRIKSADIWLARLITGEGMQGLAPVETALLAGGSHLLLVPDPQSYRIEAYTPEGKMDFALERPCVAPPLSEAEKADYRARAEAIKARLGPAFAKVPFPEATSSPCILSVTERPRGAIWVGTLLTVEEKKSNRFIWKADVFDPSGTYRETIRFSSRDYRNGDRIVFLKDCVVFIRGMFARGLEALGGPGFAADLETPGPVDLLCSPISE